jgi:formylglycine-generating enzyme required for sulfatase activity
MKNTIYLLVIVVGLAAIAAKFDLVEIPWLSERIAGLVEEESAAPVEPVVPPAAPVQPEPKAEPDPQPVPEVAGAKPVPEPAPVEPAGPEPEPAPAPAGSVPPDEVVAELHAKYETALASQALEPFEAALTKLAASYVAALDRDEKGAQAAADLDAVLHWRNERLRMESLPAAGEARGGPPAKLVEMRRTYEAETAKLAEAREVKEAELKEKYDGALAAHEKSLTQALKVEEALAVREWREPYRAVADAEPESVAAAAPALGAPGSPVRRLTLAEIDKGEVGSELEIILPGGIPMVFCWCPPGKFLMGSPPDEEGRESVADNGFQLDETQHLVELTKGYWLGKYEVTQAQWTALMETTVQDQHALMVNRDAQPWLRLSGIGPDQPMYFVNWEESVSFCKKLGRTFQIPGRWEFALPTEAQWEYACRAGTTGPYGGTGVLEEMGWHAGNSGQTTHPAGKKKANAWGLHDMHGNVWEWCADWYGEYPREAVIDPEGPRQGSHRVKRGGLFSRESALSRSAQRNPDSQSNRWFSQGLRIALKSGDN